MGLCKTCKWWGRDYKLNGEPLDLWPHERRLNARVCCNPSMGQYCVHGEPPHQGLLLEWHSVKPLSANAVGVVGDPYSPPGTWPSPLWTGPKFGCVHHEHDPDWEAHQDDVTPTNN